VRRLPDFADFQHSALTVDKPLILKDYSLEGDARTWFLSAANSGRQG
jgi:hypothetical protein